MDGWTDGWTFDCFYKSSWERWLKITKNGIYIIWLTLKFCLNYKAKTRSSAVAEATRLHLSVVSFNSAVPHYLHLATSEMWCWSGGRGILKKLSLCYSIVYYYNGAQRYEQFLQVVRLFQALILLGLALCLPSASVSSVFMVIYIYTVFQKKVHLFAFRNN